MKRVLVTGGGGFVGAALVAKLLERGYEVTIAGRNRYPAMEALGACCAVGDIGNASFAGAICANVDTVFHVAAKAGIWGSWSDYHRTNVEGTYNLIEACRRSGVAKLVYTSTPSVVFDRVDIVNGNESLPYPKSFLCHYARSKALAERLVLASNSDSLRTCAIRPHLVWGPGDPHLIPRLIERGRRNLLKIIGDGDNQVDITYIDNVVHAHLLAAHALSEYDHIGGQAYFIGQERPVHLWKWINELFAEIGIGQVTKKISFRVAFAVGTILEYAYLALACKHEPRMTRFLAEQLARTHYFSHAKAEREIGYTPIVTLEDAQHRLLKWLCTKKTI